MGENNVCRLCLEANESNVNVSEEFTKKVFDVLPPALAVSDISEFFTICKSCLEYVEKFSNYKSLCLGTQNYILSFAKDTSLMHLDLKLIYLNKKGEENISDIPPSYGICRFCMQLVNNDLVMFLNNEEKDVVLLKIMLETCLIELDLDITTDPVICVSCKNCLQSYFDFINRYLNVMGKKKEYHETVGVNNLNQVEICDVKEFTLRNTLKFEDDFQCTNSVKKENWDSEIAIDNIKQERCNAYYLSQDTNALMNTCQVSMLDEVKDLVKFEEIKVKSYPCTDIVEDEFDFKTKVGDMETRHTDLTRSSESFLPVTQELNSRDIEEHTPAKYNDKLHNTSPSQSGIGKLPKSISSKHVKYTCQVCPYRTRYVDNLNLHMLSHNNLSEVVTFKCDLCSYQSRYKSNKTKHMLSHKSSSEVQLHKCEFCLFESKYKVNLAKHMWVHKEAPEYKCDLCPFRTKRKGGLVEHTLIHKGPGEVTMYSCTECQFQTKHKRNLARHVMVHKNPSE